MSDKATSKRKSASFLFSIRTKLLATLVVFVAILMLSVIGFINSIVGETVLEKEIDKGLAVARGVAAASDDPLLTGDDLALFTVIKSVTESKGVPYGHIVRDNLVVAHSEIKSSGKEYKQSAEARLFKQGKDYSINHLIDPEYGSVYDISVPVTSARLKEGFATVHIGISRAVVDEAVFRINRVIKYIALGGFALAALGAVFVTAIIVKPVHVLADSARKLGAGDLDHRIKVTRRDEFGDLMQAFNEMGEGLKQKQFIQESFGRYVAPDLVDKILNEREMWFKGRSVEVSVLFADIRGFTSMSEKMSPEAVINLLNEYFGLMTEIILKNNGYIDKFIGDAIMVVFGSPVETTDHAICAVKTACEMQEKLFDYNKRHAEGSQVRVGIGVNSGKVVAGNLGSIQKMEYAVIGDNVNIASRLCSMAKADEIIVAKSTYDSVKDAGFKSDSLTPLSVTLKGKSTPIETYIITARRTTKDRSSQAG